ncbi:MAG: serine/threonine protein kinase [Planctomycetes bacterium]|nr:serine/threonine protein kinase [Planctomycetota bacterium]
MSEPVANGSSDEEHLDRLFGRLLEAVRDGHALDVDAEIASRPHLERDIRELVELASKTAVRKAPALPNIPGYAILRELGRGGMGTVWLARHERLDRVVALKTISAAAALGQSAKDRFEREVRAAARLSHPNIVPIFEVGDVGGVPYFTMEAIDGRSLGDVIHTLRATKVPASRLRGIDVARALGFDEAAAPDAWRRTFIEAACSITFDVAAALQHAHEAGLVHRDVKPSNVLLKRDGRAVLSDFGLARRQSDAAMTQTGDFVGSPTYASPEQADARHDEVDARSDVYSLGVSLYELLTLSVPFQGKTSHEILRRIVHDEPRSVRSLNPAVPKDLDTILRTAMEKDRTRRYASVAAFADDLRRFLSFEPIVAKPAGVVLRLVRFVQRKTAISAAIALGAALVLAIPVALWWTSRAELRAKEAELAKQEAVLKFQEDLLRSVDPNQSGRDVKVADVLDRAAKDLATAYADQPEIHARIACTVGSSYERLSLIAESERVLREALAATLPKLGDGHREIGRLKNTLGWTLSRNGAYDEAIATLRSAAATYARIFGPESYEVLSVKNNLATVLCETSAVQEGIAMLAENVAIRKRRYGATSARYQEVLYNYCASLIEFARHEDVGNSIEELIGVTDALHGKDSAAGIMARGLKTQWQMIREPEAARDALRELIEISTRVYGEFHNTTLVLRNDYAFATYSMGRVDESIAAYEELLRVREEHSGPTDPQTITVRGNLAELYLQTDRLDLAETYARTCYDHHVAKSGSRSPNAQSVGVTLVNVLLLTQRAAEAVPIAEEIVAGRKKVIGVQAPATLRSLDQLATTYAQAGRPDDARATYAEIATNTMDRALADAHMNAVASIGILSVRMDDQPEARRRFDELVAFVEQLSAPWPLPVTRIVLERAREFHTKFGDEDSAARVDALIASIESNPATAGDASGK